jgi:hypothetical protein
LPHTEEIVVKLSGQKITPGRKETLAAKINSAVELPGAWEK